MIKQLLFLSFSLLFSLSGYTQIETQPNLHYLASGAYKFIKMANSTDTTFPPSMQGWSGVETIVLPGDPIPVNVQAQENGHMVPNGSVGNGLGPLIQNQTTADASADYGISLFISNFNGDDVFPMALALGLNTINQKDIMVTWSAAGMIGNEARSGMQLQYRLGQVGDWKNVTDHFYTSIPGTGRGTEVVDSTFGPTKLPVEVENKPEVQLRWFFFNHQPARPLIGNYGEEIALHDIEVSSSSITVPVKPIADYMFSLSGNDVTFTDQSTNLPFSWFWTFDDGSTSTLQNPLHNYTEGGTYKVKLKVSNTAGVDSITKDVVIPSAPKADFSSVVLDLNVQFTDESQNDPTSWEWDFGDAGTSTIQNPSHIYAANGTYDVQLIAINSLGRDTIVKQVTIEKIFVKPLAAFDFITAADSTATFIDQSTNDPTSWLWTFGDDSTSVEQNPVHKYAAPGTYTVELMVMNSAGIDSIEKSVMIAPPAMAPIAKFEFIATQLSIAFGDSSTNSPTSWTWNFGDGAASTEQHPTHAYTTSGTYTVKLLVSNSAGKDSVTKNVTVTNVGLESELKAANAVQIYPNPANTIVHINCKSAKSGGINYLKVYNLLGKEQIEMQSNDSIFELNIQSIEPGLYLFCVYNQQNIYNNLVEIVR